ncbi:MAG: Zn-ribbon domain-containing OB-fold protein [Dehalococcoidia bacterium]|nr:Zn-ribbon domain-containing OB-fold protein [Dehalococcoidia bacterium]
MVEQAKALPEFTVDSEAYWDACAKKELRLQRCRDCRTFRFYPSPMCHAPDCMCLEYDWVQVSGRGEVYTYTVVHRPVSEAWVKDTPYVIAMIKLLEGPFMMSNVVDCPPGEVRIGMPVEVVFKDLAEGVTLPYFRPEGRRRAAR